MKNAMRAAPVLFLAALLYAGGASATTVFVMSIGARSVQVLIDGTALRTLAEGDTTPEGVTLKRIDRGAAVLEFAGRTFSAALGQTANGPMTAYLVNLFRVQVGDIVLGNVVAQVSEGGSAQLPYVLIGMSFLKQVEMQRSGGMMVLQRAQ